MNTRNLLWASIAYALFFILGASALAWWTEGIIREPNPILLKRFVLFGSVILWFSSCAALTAAVRGFVKKDYLQLFPQLLIAVICFVAPALVQILMPLIITQAELRDLKTIGIEKLRGDTARLVATADAQIGRVRTFGREISHRELPVSLQTLSDRAAYTAISKTGVVIVTDGEKGWLGGYLITPNDAVSAPATSRQIVAGVYYLRTR